MRNKEINYIALINLHNNKKITDVKHTGLLLSDLFLEPFINNGMMFVSFHLHGITNRL